MNTLKIAEKNTEQIEHIEGSAIGHILAQAGRLTMPDLQRILALQTKENILFGEAAVTLGILTDEDVRWALANQYNYPCTSGDTSRLSPELLVLHEPYSPQVETFRSIRSALFMSGVGKRTTTLAVLSPGSGEGKTFVAANLALLFAQLGSRTLLLDLNFRAPRLHTLFQQKNNCGASSLIIKRAFIDEAVQQTPLSTLQLLPAGPKPPNPLELLSWDETRHLLTGLKEQYEVIIVDTPAFTATADSQLIAGVCDGSLLVAAQGTTKNAAIAQVKKQLDTTGAKLIGAVVNELEVRR
jgi:chain length determinant protein tyrosine kinase EpsG